MHCYLFQYRSQNAHLPTRSTVVSSFEHFVHANYIQRRKATELFVLLKSIFLVAYFDSFRSRSSFFCSSWKFLWPTKYIESQQKKNQEKYTEKSSIECRKKHQAFRIEKETLCVNSLIASVESFVKKAIKKCVVHYTASI